MSSDEFIRLLIAAPAGVALLQHLEAEQRRDTQLWAPLLDSDPHAVDAAAAAVSAMSVAGLAKRAVDAADQIAGPWNPMALTSLPAAYRFAGPRVGIAQEIARRFTATLATDIDRSRQQWWNTADDRIGETATHLRVPADVGYSYCCGEWPWRRAWTVTAPPPELHETLAAAWEMYTGDIHRWEFEVSSSARIFEIHHPDDWRRLVSMYPLDVSGKHGGWEMPGRNQHRSDVADVTSASSGRAARLDVRVAMPDWRLIAEDWDGVHLSWAGMLTCEGHVLDVPEVGPSVVTMLRFWFTERTLWFRSSAFGAATGLPAATMTGALQSTPVSAVDGPTPDFSCWPL